MDHFSYIQGHPTTAYTLRDRFITNYLKLRLHLLLCAGMDSVTLPRCSMVLFI